MTELKPESATIEHTGALVDSPAEQDTAKPVQGFFPEAKGKKYKTGDVLTVLVEANAGFSGSIDDVVFGGTTYEKEPFLFEDGSLQEMINVDRFVEFSPELIETFTYTNEECGQRQGRTTANQPLFYLRVMVTGYDISGSYSMMRVKPLLPEMPGPSEIRKPVEFSQQKNELVRKARQAVFSDDFECLGNLMQEFNIFKSELARYDALHKAGRIGKKHGKVSLMAKELSFASLKEAVNTVNMVGDDKNYRRATMDDYAEMLEIVKMQIPYFTRLNAETKKQIEAKVKESIQVHDTKVMSVNGRVVFFAAYNPKFPQIVGFGYKPVPGVNETLVATWGLRRCLSSFSSKYGVDTFFVDAGADDTEFGKSNSIDLIEKRIGVDAYKIIGGHRFYSIAILSNSSESLDKSPAT